MSKRTRLWTIAAAVSIALSFGTPATAEPAAKAGPVVAQQVDDDRDLSNQEDNDNDGLWGLLGLVGLLGLLGLRRRKSESPESGAPAGYAAAAPQAGHLPPAGGQHAVPGVPPASQASPPPVRPMEQAPPMANPELPRRQQ
jgi:MYXO-CTERM domain-containing protein